MSHPNVYQLWPNPRQERLAREYEQRVDLYEQYSANTLGDAVPARASHASHGALSGLRHTVTIAIAAWFTKHWPALTIGFASGMAAVAVPAMLVARVML